MSAGIAERVLERVQRSGGRSTVPTRLVVTILSETEHHLTADDLINEIERRAPGIAASTVYRVLQRLDELDLVEHVHSGAGAAFYHLREHSHAHLVCTECACVVDLAEPASGALRLLRDIALDAHGFTLDPHHAALLGRCQRCSGVDSPLGVRFQKK